MSDTDTYWTLQAAVAYGGSFYKALAEAGLKADPSNRQRLLTAFPEMADTYGPASTLHRQLRDEEAHK